MYRKSKYLGPQAVRVLCREVYYIHCPYLGGSTIGGFTVVACLMTVIQALVLKISVSKSTVLPY